MAPLKILLSKISGLFRKARLEQQLDDDVRAHLEMLIDENLRKGMAPEEARYAALRKFGNVSSMKEECRETWSIRILEELIQDFRYGLGQLRRNPGFTAVAVLTLALGIGANTAVFTLVDAVLFRPLPVKHVARLTVVTTQSGKDSDPGEVSYPDYLDYRRCSAFSDVTAYVLDLDGLGFHGQTDRIMLSFVPSNFFTMLGIRPALGHLILPGEGDESGTGPVVVLGYSYWERRFSGDPKIIGQIATLDGRAVTIIGVVPKQFHGPYHLIEVDAYAPIGMITVSHSPYFFTTRWYRNMNVLGMLKPRVSVRQAQAELDVISQRLAQQYPQTDKDEIVRVFPETMARPVAEAAETTPKVAIIFLALVGLVLLIACFNVTNLLLARAMVRKREIAVRSALGAGRLRLIRQLLTESILLASAGTVAGALAGYWATSALRALPPVEGFQVNLGLAFDWRVFGYVTAAALSAGFLAGLVPALRASRVQASPDLRTAGRGILGRSSRHRLSDVLVIAQVAGSMLLLVIAGLFIRSLTRAKKMHLGFDPHHVLNATIDPKLDGYNRAQAEAFFRRLLRSARDLPGVKSASFAYSVPTSYYHGGAGVYAEGQPTPPAARVPIAVLDPVSTDYFKTMRMPLLQGRTFTAADTSTSERVAVVNETMARRLWPDQNPLGKRFSYEGPSGPWVRVVGLVQDVRFLSLLHEPGMMFFAPGTQMYRPIHVLQLRTSVTPQSLAPSVENLVRGLDPEVPVYDVMSMERTLEGINGFFLLKMGAAFAGVLGGLGLLLALVGLYGVVSYSAKQRVHEIGVRMALGATRWSIFSLVVRQAIVLVGGGVGLGFLAALAATRIVGSLLFGASGDDLDVYAVVSALLVAVSLTAVYIPARRAAPRKSIPWWR